MNEINNTIWNRRMPSFFGIFFLLIAVGTITWLSRNAILFGTKAALSTEPKDITISNISDTAFTVSYVTDGAALGSINFGTSGKTDQIRLDDRDQTVNQPQPHTVHFITVTKLTPLTKYTFSITSGDKVYLNSGAPYVITTGNQLSSAQATNQTLSGRVTLDDGTAPAEALVYVSSNNSQLLSMLIKPDGSYKIPLATLRDKTLAAFVNLTQNDVLKLSLEDSTRKSQVSLLASQTNPVPIIILSQNYDFSVSDQPLASASPSASLSLTPAAFPTLGGSTIFNPQIITPQKDQSFKDPQPLFKGKAVPNANVTITINSTQTITSTVQTDANGNWQYRPDIPLDPGTHTITMSTLDASGLIKTISQSFTVYAAGSQFTEPSISPTQAVTPTTIPTVTPTINPTATGTPAPTVTKTPSPITTKIPSVSPTNPPVPVTGSNNSLLLSVAGGISAVGVGALLFFLTAL